MIYMLILVLISVVGSYAIEPDASETLGYGRFRYEYRVLESLVQLRDNDTHLLDMYNRQQSLLNELTSEVQVLKARRLGGSSMYVRWGRTTCPGNGTELVYDGYVGGSHYSHSGAAVDYLCLPKDPDWGHYEDAFQGGGFVYGAEYQYNQKASSAEFFSSQTSNLIDNYVPCAVCQSTRSSVLMVPAKNQCHPGWTIEYHGYLSAGKYDHAAASEYVCVDGEAELSDGGKHTNENGILFYFVEGRCGSLKCPPYVDGRELTCVVCTKKILTINFITVL